MNNITENIKFRAWEIAADNDQFFQVPKIFVSNPNKYLVGTYLMLCQCRGPNGYVHSSVHHLARLLGTSRLNNSAVCKITAAIDELVKLGVLIQFKRQNLKPAGYFDALMLKDSEAVALLNPRENRFAVVYGRDFCAYASIAGAKGVMSFYRYLWNTARLRLCMSIWQRPEYPTDIRKPVKYVACAVMKFSTLLEYLQAQRNQVLRILRFLSDVGILDWVIYDKVEGGDTSSSTRMIAWVNSNQCSADRLSERILGKAPSEDCVFRLVDSSLSGFTFTGICSRCNMC